MSRQQHYDGIDLMKFIASIFVVGIHTHPLIEHDAGANFVLFQCIGRLGVPFFFVASSFFYFRKESAQEWTTLKKFIKRMLTMYGVWFLIMLPITVYRYFIEKDAGFFEKCFVLIKQFFFGSTYRGSWYLMGTIVGIVLIWSLSKIIKSELVLFLIGVPFYVICILTSGYRNFPMGNGQQIWEFCKEYFVTPYNSVITGIIFVAMGHYFAKQEEKIVSKKSCISMLLTVVGITGVTWEMLRLRNMGYMAATDCFFMLVPTVFVLFYTLLTIKVEIKDTAFFRAASTITFFLQFLLIAVMRMTNQMGITKISNMDMFASILVLSWGLTEIIMRLEKKQGWHWLKNLH